MDRPAVNCNIIPGAIQCPEIKTKWTYKGGWCEGAILHFTAGRNDPMGTVNYLGSAGYPCLVMGRDGKVYQAFRASRGGPHCGTHHHDFSMGLEVISAGRCLPVMINGVQKYAPWYALTPENKVRKPIDCLPESEVRYVDTRGSCQEGWYQKYTPAQEESIIKLFMWYKWVDPTKRFSFDKVLGHNEACDLGGRRGQKCDPSGALSMSMDELRDLLKKRYAELEAQPIEAQMKFFGY